MSGTIDLQQVSREQIDQLEEAQGDRVYVTAYSGHGSSLRFEAESFPDPSSWTTQDEAQQAATDWESEADTIGGRGEAVNMIELLNQYLEQPDSFIHLPFLDR